jgi:transposase
MLTIGVDPHKRTHSVVAVDELGVQLAISTQRARREGFGILLAWSRSLPGECTWVAEDCRHVSGPFERFLIDHGEKVVRLPPRLMADARRGVRERGKSERLVGAHTRLINELCVGSYTTSGPTTRYPSAR